ncbi:MAG: MAPEG family protein, partial [Usitatibacteraceae bacterium]
VQSKLILFPIVAMVALTFTVAVTMLRRRIGAMKSKRIHPQKVAMSAQMSALIEDSRASDNFRNLFETPVLFYVAIIIIYTGGFICLPHLVLAWGYVFARYAHSAIQCTSNVVMSRFYAFLTSIVLLLCIWLMLFYQLLTATQGT